jgi:phenylalanyl-tRNA synthetase beta chain
MKIVTSWLREFVDVRVPPAELGQTLSMRGFELASIEEAPETGAGKPDAVLDFEITANRPDCLSVIGLARETATAYSLPLQLPDALSGSDPDAAPDAAVKVTLEAPDLCPRYSAAVAEVTVGPSPEWLAGRLQASGIRPINNIVDVTNYVLLELGQPMHAFDLSKLADGELRIRRALKGERIKTLDGADRALDEGMLVIADARKPQAVAGVMGGGLSEVSGSTRMIVLESACFQPRSVRLTSKRLGLKTEASARFERGTDIGAPVAGIRRALSLLGEIGAGKAQGSIIDEYPNRRAPRQLTLRRSRIARILGQTVPDADVDRILTGLGFGIQRDRAASDWQVSVPTFRVDVSREVDLIEEVGRHYGYDKLPTTFPALDAAPPPPDPRIERDRTVRRVLLAAGCSEAVTFSFIAAGAAAPFADPSAIVPISNPLTAQFAVLRPSLLPGLLAAVEHNRHRERPDVCLFEVGATVTREGQRHHAAVVWTGDAGAAHWSTPHRDVDFFDVKGLAERIGEALNVDLEFDASSIPAYLTRGRAATIKAGGQAIGVMGLLTQDHDVYAAEVDLDALSARSAGAARAPLTFTPLPRHPSIARDISIVIDDTLPAAAVRGTIRSAAPDTLVSVREFDRYQGKGVPDGRVSLSLRLTFRSPDRTLTDAEVEGAMKHILAALSTAHHAVQR